MKKTEKLSQEVLEKINSGQLKINEAILNIGQIELRTQEINKEIEKLNSLKNENIAKFETANNEFNELLSDLEKQYPNGEIDLKEGVVIFEG